MPKSTGKPSQNIRQGEQKDYYYSFFSFWFPDFCPNWRKDKFVVTTAAPPTYRLQRTLEEKCIRTRKKRQLNRRKVGLQVKS